MADKTFVQLVVTAIVEPEIKTINGQEVISFYSAAPTGYGEDAEDMKLTVDVWPNTRDDRGDFQQFVKENIHKGSRGIFVEGFLAEKPGKNFGQVYRNLSPSRMGLVEYAERSSLVAAGASDGDDY